MKSIKAIFRRGQTSKLENQTSENVSRSSSVNNLNVEPKAKGAKPKKAESKERLDKVAKPRLNRNNNKEEDKDPLPNVDSLQQQLSQMADDKSALTSQLAERTAQLSKLQQEISYLKTMQQESNLELERLTKENSLLRNRPRDVAHSPLSDNEKQQLLYESHRHHSSAPASIATNVLEDGGDVTSDWDKASSGNVSEVSVACLQDKINQMQETHYSTNEELQATLQELTDLQKQLTGLQQENLRLNDEKNLMFESLCRQTERLNDSRNEVESLKQFVYKDENAAAREEKLVEMLKSAQEDRDTLLLNQEHFTSELGEARSQNSFQKSEIQKLIERVKTLESSLDARQAEYRLLDRELGETRDRSSGRKIEIGRLKELLENARTKIGELELDRAATEKSDVDELLDNARKEKDALESEVAHLNERLALSKNDNSKLKEQISILQEECKVTRNNAKTTRSDLEYKLEKIQSEKSVLVEQIQQLQEACSGLQMQSQCHADEKLKLSAVLSETQRNLNESEGRIIDLSNALTELKKTQEEQEEEWEKFQDDLLTSVRVANDFKTEAQQDLQKLIMENKAGRERVKQLEAQIEKLKATNEAFSLEELSKRKPKLNLSRQTSRQSVKSLIETIENAGKPVKSLNLNAVSRSNSSASVSSNASDGKTPDGFEGEWSEPIKTPLKEQTNKFNKDWGKAVISDKSELVKSKTDDNFKESILQKSLDFARRNSYSDLSERKDPLNGLVKNGGSKRNALLKWCQNKTVGYRNIDITNFSSSWNDGLALCALLHTYLPERISYDSLTPQEKRRNFTLAFSAAESVGITTTLNINDMIQLERPDWQQVMAYVTAIYKHFET